ncbi:hypothetical protein [Acanthopleuribacter pedis]|uniref:Methyltransferase domain-containing protein n=1 Tax=Acanthopleuribacter pedis TaxID=442870 RepID=A0A8J7Q497_9BACT|nr:hypothetical protein [Acanthopleuribacter pedis]MBO1317446.1 hypothetical protein [Acanthopleuribacter pedis]
MSFFNEPVPWVRDQPLIDILIWLERQSATHATGALFQCVVPNPDWGAGCYPGEIYERDGEYLCHRALPIWFELAERVACRLRTPRWRADDWLALTFEVLDPQKVPHWFVGPRAEKYEPGTDFSKIVRTEEPTFLHHYLHFIRRIPKRNPTRVLLLGVGQGWEVVPFLRCWSPDRLAETELIGIDHAARAVAAAQARFGSLGPRFLVADLGGFDFATLGVFDVIVAINVLHSPALDGHRILHRLLTHHCRPNSRVLFGFPNCRYLDGEVRYGTRVGKQRETEMTPLLQEVGFYRRTLIKHHFDVKVHGKHTVLVEGTRKQFAR